MIFELLTEGAEHARTGRDLARLLNCGIREITEQVEKERRAGQPICASSSGGEGGGYYLAATREELEQYCKRLNKRAGELHKTRRALVSQLERLPPEEPHDQS